MSVGEQLRRLIAASDEEVEREIVDRPGFVAALIFLRAGCDVLIHRLGTEGLQFVKRTEWTLSRTDEPVEP
jgi:hypothetical protein